MLKLSWVLSIFCIRNKRDSTTQILYSKTVSRKPLSSVGWRTGLTRTDQTILLITYTKDHNHVCYRVGRDERLKSGSLITQGKDMTLKHIKIKSIHIIKKYTFNIILQITLPLKFSRKRICTYHNGAQETNVLSKIWLKSPSVRENNCTPPESWAAAHKKSFLGDFNSVGPLWN